MESGYPGAPPGWYPDPAGGPGQRWWDGYTWTEATVLPQHPPPPPWATAGPPRGPATEVAPWAVAAGRLSAALDARCGRARAPHDRCGTHRGGRAGRVLHRFLHRLPVPRRRVPRARSPAARGLARRADRQDSAGVPRPERVHDGQPGDQPCLRGGGDRRADLAAPRRVGRARARDPVPALAGVGRRLVVRARRLVVDPLHRRTRLPPPERHPPRPGPALVARLVVRAGRRLRGGRLRAVLLGTALVLAVPVLFANVAIVFWAPGIVSAIALVAPRRPTG